MLTVQNSAWCVTVSCGSVWAVIASASMAVMLPCSQKAPWMVRLRFLENTAYKKMSVLTSVHPSVVRPEVTESFLWYAWQLAWLRRLSIKHGHSYRGPFPSRVCQHLCFHSHISMPIFTCPIWIWFKTAIHVSFTEVCIFRSARPSLSPVGCRSLGSGRSPCWLAGRAHSSCRGPPGACPHASHTQTTRGPAPDGLAPGELENDGNITSLSASS